MRGKPSQVMGQECGCISQCDQRHGKAVSKGVMSCNASSEDHSDLFGGMNSREGSKRGNGENNWERLLPWSRGEMKEMWRRVEVD